MVTCFLFLNPLLALKLKVFSALIFFQNLICGCTQERKDLSFAWEKSGYKAERLFMLPKEVDECSGSARFTDSSFLTHNDDGEPCLFEVAYNGRQLNRFCLPGATNRDWEDMAMDDSGNVYACDVGNNLNLRRDLTIYKYNLGSQMPAKAIRFRYSDQTEFPPEKKHRNFDCEAVVWMRDSLFLFSKNRGDKTIRTYAIPDLPGSHEAIPVASVKLRKAITGADINPAKTRLALVGYGVVYLFDVSKGNSWFSKPLACLRFARSGQSEAVWFKDDSTFYVANEGNHVFYFRPDRNLKKEK